MITKFLNKLIPLLYRSSIPKKGEMWRLRQPAGDPFAKKEYTVKVLDVKDGWVRYYQNSIFSDQRLVLHSFIDCYEFFKQD